MFKRCLIFAWSSPPPPEVWDGGEAFAGKAESFSVAEASAAPFVNLLPFRGIGLYKYMEYGIMLHNVV